MSEEELTNLDKGFTNNVFRTSEGNILKRFSSHHLESIFLTVFNFLRGDFQFLNWKWRKEQEVKMSEKLRSEGFSVPEIIEVREKSVIMTEIKAKELTSWINSNSTVKGGRKVGGELKRLHEKGFAILDANLDNFLLSKDEIFTVDHEYTEFPCSEFAKKWDLLNIVAGAFKLGKSDKEDFINGFEQGYRKIKTHEYILGRLIALIVTMLVKRDLRKTLNVVKN